MRQLSKRNLERQNTLYDEEQYDQPLDTCSELNYNINYNNETSDQYGYNQQWQNGEPCYYDSYGYTNNKKTLPQPPMSYSQSVTDGFSHRSLPATPVASMRYNRQLPKHTSPTHQPQSRGLPNTRHLPSSLESAASTFTSLFGGRNSKRNVPATHEPDTHVKSLFSLLSESKPQVSQPENYIPKDHSNYNENYNYAYHSIDSDELMVIEEKFDDDSNVLTNGRLGAALLPSVPSYEKTTLLDYDPYRQVSYKRVIMTN